MYFSDQHTPPNIYKRFSFAVSIRYKTKENNDLDSVLLLKSLQTSHLEPVPLYFPNVLGLGGCAQITVTPIATAGANTGCLAPEQERWKASSNVITDGLSVPFELFTDWVNDYRQCVSWPGARNSYPPVRYYQRGLPCLAGVLPKHLTEMPTQKEECSECACALSWDPRKKVKISSIH